MTRNQKSRGIGIIDVRAKPGHKTRGLLAAGNLVLECALGKGESALSSAKATVPRRFLPCGCSMAIVVAMADNGRYRPCRSAGCASWMVGAMRQKTPITIVRSICRLSQVMRRCGAMTMFMMPVSSWTGTSARANEAVAVRSSFTLPVRVIRRPRAA